MYFGLRFYYSSIDIMISVSRLQPLPVLRTPELEEKGKKFIRLIKGDVLALRWHNVGGEKMNGNMADTAGYYKTPMMYTCIITPAMHRVSP